MKDDADPFDGWSYNEYIKCISTAKNDVYGAFFYYLRNMLLAFCKRIRSCRMAFQLLAVNAVTSRGLHQAAQIRSYRGMFANIAGVAKLLTTFRFPTSVTVAMWAQQSPSLLSLRC